MTIYLELGDYCEIAAELLGTTVEQIARLPRIALADSALATPQAGFGGRDAYPTLIEKAAVLLVEHLARNHPLPDGNKRAAFLSVWLFLEINGQPFDGEDTERDVPMVERIAAGEATPNEIIGWLEIRTSASSRRLHAEGIDIRGEASSGRSQEGRQLRAPGSPLDTLSSGIGAASRPGDWLPPSSALQRLEADPEVSLG